MGWNKLWHILHGNGVAPPPGLELAATRSNRNTQRRRFLRKGQQDKLSSAMFVVDLQFRTLHQALQKLGDGAPCLGTADDRRYSMKTLLAMRKQTGLEGFNFDGVPAAPPSPPTLPDCIVLASGALPAPPAYDPCISEASRSYLDSDWRAGLDSR